MLVGRERELAVIERLLNDARDGRSRSLLVCGEPGIGKSALLEEAARMAAGFQVLRTRPVAGEAILPFGALHALLRPALGALDRIPELQARMLARALALEEGEPVDLLAVGAGTLSLIAETAEESPVLVLVDDAHWLDPESAGALAFAARRLVAEEVALLAAARSGGPDGFRPGDFETLELEPLGEDAAARLLRNSAHALDEAAAARILAAALGNPLALVELALRPRRPTEAVSGIALTERLAETYLGSVRSLPEGTQTALLVAAAGEGLDSATLARAAARAGAGTEPFVAAEAAGLVQLDRGRFSFRHPLVRSAVYQGASPGDRRAAHRAVASVLDRDGDADRRAWQLAAAADGPDEAVAQELEAAADRAEMRGGARARAQALEWAADLSEDEDARGHRLHAAARAAHWAGEPDRALELIARVLPTVSDPLVRADLVHERAGILDFRGERVPDEVLEGEAARVEGIDPERSAKLRSSVLTRALDDLDAVASLRAAAKVEPLLPRLGDFWAPRLRAGVAQVYLLAGKTAQARDLYASILDDPDAAATHGIPLVWLEWYDDARRVLELSHDNGRRTGQTLRVAWTRACLGVLEASLGRFPAAVAAAGEALALADEIPAGFIAMVALRVLAEVAAVQGRADECRAFAGRLAEIGAAYHDEHSRCSAAVALGRLELGAGRHTEAIAHLRPVAEYAHTMGVADPSVMPYGPDLVEAYTRNGMTDEARSELDRLARQAEATERPWALASAARCEALLAPDDELDERFALALERHQRVRSPFERARTDLCHGERLRRAGRRVDARAALRSALSAFEDLDAVPWADRARAELKATGETARKRDPSAAEQLTPQELQIALLVAEGRSNKEVAAALYLSAKTVEYHLTRVYRKLNVYSRTELTRLMAAGTPTC